MAGLLHFIGRFRGGIASAFLVLATLAICGIWLPGCGRSGERHGAISGPYYVKRLNVEPADLYADLGLERIARFEIKAPVDAKCLIWLETYKHGKLVPKLSWGYYRRPLRERRSKIIFIFPSSGP